jgi:hypothetical protein
MVRSPTVSIVQFPRDVASSVLKVMKRTGSWATIRKQERRRESLARENRAKSEVVRPLPKLSHLKTMLDVAYVASMMEEEGRRVAFTLAYLSERGAREMGHHVFPFQAPLPLKPNHLAKYALAAAPLTTSFAVWPRGRGLDIWGLVQHGNHTFALDLSFRPTYLSVRVLRSGTFMAEYDGYPLLLFSRDHVRLYDEDVLKRVNLVDILRDRLRIDPTVGVALRRVCQRMVALGHGGTILVTEKDKAKKALKMHDTLTARGMPLAMLKDVVEAERRELREANPKPPVREGTAVHQRYTQEEKHREALDFVAQLTAVDGAVVLDNELNIYGFGATIATGGAQPKVTTEHPASLGKKRPYDLERRGNRHRSAVAFCAQQMGAALALVASQDGDFSVVMAERNGSVHVIGPYELGVGL